MACRNILYIANIYSGDRVGVNLWYSFRSVKIKSEAFINEITLTVILDCMHARIISCESLVKVV